MDEAVTPAHYTKNVAMNMAEFRKLPENYQYVLSRHHIFILAFQCKHIHKGHSITSEV